MSNINMQAIFGVGNITKDFEVRTSQTGTPFATIGIAINLRKDEQPLFLDLKVGGKTAENAGKYLHRGDQVGFAGTLRNESWEKDGKKYYRTVVSVDQLSFGNKAGGGQYNMNFISFAGVGNLVSDPASLGDGRVASMDIAINDPFDKARFTVVRVKCSGTTASNVLRFLRKGSQAAILDASLLTEAWEKDGVRHTRLVAWTDNVQFGNAPKAPEPQEFFDQDAPADEQAPEVPVATQAPVAPKAPKAPKVAKDAQAPKAPRAPRAPKAVKEDKVVPAYVPGDDDIPF